jgi:hypothetical protein
MEKIIWTDLVRNEEESRGARGEEEGKMKRRKANSIGHIKRRNCLLKHVVEGKIEGTKRRRRRRKQLLDICKEREDTGSLKKKKKKNHIVLSGELVLDEAVGLLVRQTAKVICENLLNLIVSWKHARRLSGKYKTVLNNSRPGRVAMM